MKITNEIISQFDSANMFDVLKNFPNQIKEASEIGKNSDGFSDEIVSNDFLVLGMGGSAIGGDIVSSFCSSTDWAKHIRISVNRGYSLPGWVNEYTNVIASSYSGNTEETIIAFQEALKITKRIVCISTGGKLTELAQQNGIPVIKIPTGFQPRCALAYSFFPMMYLLLKSNAFTPEASAKFDSAMNELIDLMFKKSDIYSSVENDKNLALILSSKLSGSIPVIYSSSERLDSVNLRWRCQINENSKQLCYGSLLPEMNHNEINSWTYPNDLLNRFSVVFLKDPYDNPRIKIRFNALHEIIESSVKHLIELKGEGENLLTRIFDLIYLGDWLSFYLAINNGTDPTPIPFINRLKEILSKE